MSSHAARKPDDLSPFEQLRLARQIIEHEGSTLLDVARRLDGRFCRALELVHDCRGSVIVCGMGKAGLVGQKIMATLASTGTRSHFLHPAEAVHGDLGRVQPDDVMLILSQSGQTEEIVRILPFLGDMGVPILAVTARTDSALAKAAAVVLELGPVEEACSLGLAPSASTTAMLALGDALALVASRMQNFGREDFARSHPAGSLGRKLSKVDHYLRPLERCRVAHEQKTVRQVFVDLSVPGRRTGAIMLVDAEGRLSGIFTDSDLARLFEHRREEALDRPVGEVMTAGPAAVRAGTRMIDAVATMAQRKISELPVVDADGRPVGLIDVTDVIGIFPELGEHAEQRPSKPEYRVFHEPRAG